METVFLFCFSFGAGFVIVTTLLGLLGAGLHGIGSHIHLPGLGHGHGLGGHIGHGAAHGLGAHAAAHGVNAVQHAHGAIHGATHGHGLSVNVGAHTSLLSAALGLFLNPSAILAGMTVFGGVGYGAMHFYMFVPLLALALAIPSGLASSTLVGAFLAKLREDAGTMLDADFSLEGTLALVTVTIGAGKCGEVVFELGGRRRAEGARALGSQPIPKGTSVLILRYEHGLALVEPTSEVANSLGAEHHLLAPPRSEQEELG